MGLFISSPSWIKKKKWRNLKWNCLVKTPSVLSFQLFVHIETVTHYHKVVCLLLEHKNVHVWKCFKMIYVVFCLSLSFVQKHKVKTFQRIQMF